MFGSVGDCFLKCFLFVNVLKIISIYFFKNIFNISLLKWCENIKKILI
jgi:hypothetical protein